MFKTKLVLLIAGYLEIKRTFISALNRFIFTLNFKKIHNSVWKQQIKNL